jgi:hypothetical protein
LNKPEPKEVVKIDEKKTTKKVMKWGQPTWFLFHTLAEKIKPEHFAAVRVELLNNINVICANLPCPNCAKHASTYMAGVNFNAIQTKDDLRVLMYRFHNEVNRKKGFPLFNYDDLTPQYEKANTVAVIHHFMSHFEDKHSSIRMIADDLHRARLSSLLKSWFSRNIGYFEL